MVNNGLMIFTSKFLWNVFGAVKRGTTRIIVQTNISGSPEKSSVI
jgi:hypothetical protein